MGKQKGLISVWRCIYDVPCTTFLTNGNPGYHWLNYGITHLGILPWVALLSERCMDTIPTWVLHQC